MHFWWVGSICLEREQQNRAPDPSFRDNQTTRKWHGFRNEDTRIDRNAALYLPVIKRQASDEKRRRYYIETTLVEVLNSKMFENRAPDPSFRGNQPTQNRHRFTSRGYQIDCNIVLHLQLLKSRASDKKWRRCFVETTIVEVLTSEMFQNRAPDPSFRGNQTTRKWHGFRNQDKRIDRNIALYLPVKKHQASDKKWRSYRVETTSGPLPDPSFFEPEFSYHVSRYGILIDVIIKYANNNCMNY